MSNPVSICPSKSCHLHSPLLTSCLQSVFPWECRDKEDQAKAFHTHPVRRANQSLAEENQRLKRLLRENGISWSPIARAHLNANTCSSARGKAGPSTRSAVANLHRPYLPVEVILRILKFALTSSEPIIDPLWPLINENLTEREKSRGNQVAIHFLVTCKAMHLEGTKIFWQSNSFIFTSPQVLQNFSELGPEFRDKVTHISLRVIARYYDDQHRKHKLERSYHTQLKKDQPLKVSRRPKESALTRGGFRCYTWNQIADFLIALRAPHDPTFKNRTQPRPRLLPSLTSLRLDLVNFADGLLPFPGSELHDLASHELGCTFNELQVTGMPDDDAGIRATAELSGLLKDEGLYLSGPPAFLAQSKHLQPLGGCSWFPRVVRAWVLDDEDLDMDEDDEHEHHSFGRHPKLGALPPAPAEEGHPLSGLNEDLVIWKKIPRTRDALHRNWALFSRATGHEIEDWDSYCSDDEICSCCGDFHPEMEFLEFLESQLF
ncbi:hypothetical protein HJFPF1_03203 [Paramyrothecium foliicola]|nr:hypothetical protein HJFPF1_03203 [Paramyrothecium foliicola]